MSENNKTSKKIDRRSLRQMLHIYSYMLPYKGVFIIGMVFLVLGTITALMFPAVVGALLDSSISSQTSFLVNYFPDFKNLGITPIAWILIGILIFQAIFSFFKVVIFAYVSENVMGDIRKDLFSQLLSLNITFFEKNRVGELTSRLTADVTQLQEVLSWTLGEFFRQIFTLIIGAIVISFISWKLSLIMLSTFPVIIIGAVIFGRFIKKMSKATQKALADSNVVAEEGMQNIQVVKAFANELFEATRYNRNIAEVVSYALKMAGWRGVFASFIILGIFGSIVFVLWYGFTMVSQGTLSAGDLLTFVIYTVYIGASVGGMSDLYSRIQKAVGASERIREILGEDVEVKINEKISALDLIGNVSYKNVQFSYPTRTDVQVLNGISFDIRKGEKVAFVGSSGAGKSTITQLLQRFYPLENGQITVDDKNIADYNITAFRKNIGVVPQEVILFGGTIRENIHYGNPDASEEDLKSAAQQANAWEFIENFPEGLDTVVGERGIKLSGGQRQRIAIARAILKNPSILILDEATSSLDSESEKLVQDALDVLMEGRTSIIIAHRLSTIRDVDQIFVLEKGKIVEQGTHNELSVRDGGKYQAFLQLQNDGTYLIDNQ